MFALPPSVLQLSRDTRRRRRANTGRTDPSSPNLVKLEMGRKGSFRKATVSSGEVPASSSLPRSQTARISSGQQRTAAVICHWWMLREASDSGMGTFGYNLFFLLALTQSSFGKYSLLGDGNPLHNSYPTDSRNQHQQRNLVNLDFHPTSHQPTRLPHNPTVFPNPHMVREECISFSPASNPLKDSQRLRNSREALQLGGNRITPDTLVKEVGFYSDFFQSLLGIQEVGSESCMSLWTPACF